MQKFKKRLMVSVLIATMGLVTSCSNISSSTVPNDEVVADSEQLRLFKSDAEVNQETRMSMMKAGLLQENQGYVDSDIVTAILQLDGNSLIDYYLDSSSSADSVSSYADTEIGRLNARVITNAQTKLLDKMRGQGLIKTIEHHYKTVINAVSVTMTYGNFKLMDEYPGISKAILSDTYNLPQATSVEDANQPVENVVDVYDTGIFNSSTVDFDGTGTAVAVLDSGFDCSHTVFNTLKPDPDRLLIDQDHVGLKLPHTNAYTTTADLKVSDVWYSDKIPYVYDYADLDPDVNPYDSEHGTHVAGIIGGQDSTITGVAVNTQLVLMKVFPDLDSGASTDDIIAALDDAVTLNVDAINMSLGSSCGFTREVDEAAINTVYDKIEDAGISLITAASNSYSSGYGSANGNTSKVTNPDSGTVGSPSTYSAALSVASISGVKSQYITANDDHIFFFNQSNDIAGHPYDFFEGLKLPATGDKTFEYVTVPGVGMSVNYTSIDVQGKIALVRRGTNTFEEKAKLAAANGAVACIIYNNVAGDILMSMGKSVSIPTISISKDDGTTLASRDSGKLVMNRANLAGPFMSDFSSWGPTPDLKLKPEITAHGGEILSAIPGGGYDRLSGTSMASPNMCGIVVLIRQYLKEKYPEKSFPQIATMANELLMSTATIALNQEGNPYSPRKQGAGLASLKNAVTSGALITIDDSTKAKLELGDDKTKSGVYEMEFNVENIASSTLSYDLSVIGMTESVSTADDEYVAEMATMLNGATKVEVISGGQLEGSTLSIAQNGIAKVKVTYTISDADKKFIDDSFPNGMYVEGFVSLKSKNADAIDLNCPFLAFYGDWTQAPMFDKTYYEVESEAHDQSIDEEDKLKADYYATTPYGSYFYNYIIPLGSYLYDIDTSQYLEIPATEDHIAISDTLGCIDGIASVYAGLLRGAKAMVFTIKDAITGEEIYSHTDYNAHKSFSQGGSPIPYYDFLRISSYRLGLVNNKQYEFTMTGVLDYEDGGVNTNLRNSFGFKFYLDNEAPTLTGATFDKVYDRTTRKDRYYINLTVSDNQYVQSIAPVIFTSNKTYTTLTENPIPVYGESGQATTVRFEITEYLNQLYSDAIAPNSISFVIDDYALNSNIFVVELPGLDGELKFTKDGTLTGEAMNSLSLAAGEYVDLTQYLTSDDINLDTDKDYLKYLTWSSSNTNVATIKDGVVTGVAAGRVTINVLDQTNGHRTSIMVRVTAPTTPSMKRANASDIPLEGISFSYYDTLYAHDRAGDTSEIGVTGSRNYFTATSTLSFYPGERIQITPQVRPTYLPESRYELVWSSTNPSVVSVDQDGVVMGLKEGSATIRLNIIIDDRQSSIMATQRVSIKSEFVIENRILTAYKGIGGDVVIPDDEGILYIGEYAFCLYTTDNSIEITDDNYNANKIPGTNNTVTSVVVPDGVEDIQAYAFYNCTELKSVTLPDSVKYIRDYSFYNDAKLTDINIGNTIAIGQRAFAGCVALDKIDLSKVYAIGVEAFLGCTSLTTVDLSALRNSGARAFQRTSKLTQVTLSDDTVLSYAMFAYSGLTSVSIGSVRVPDFCFAHCEDLQSVTITRDIISIGEGAFSDCSALTEVVFEGSIQWIYDQAFYNCLLLQTIALPNNAFNMGSYVFFNCEQLTTINLGYDTDILSMGGGVFRNTNVARFEIPNGSIIYGFTDNNSMVIKDKYVVLIAPKTEIVDYILDDDIVGIASGAFSGIAGIATVSVGADFVSIGDYAFANCPDLVSIDLERATGTVSIGAHAFNSTGALANIYGMEKVNHIGEYAFAYSAINGITLPDDIEIEEGAFFRSTIREITLGANNDLGLGVFQYCTSLVTVNMPSAGGVLIGNACFAFATSLSTLDFSKVGDTIADQAFYGCTGLRTANMTNVKYIGDYAFADCAGLSTVTIPSIITIGEGAFARYSENGGAPQISQIELPNTLVAIGDGAFLGSSLTSVTIPSSVTEYGGYLFAYCVDLVTVVLPSNMTSINTYSFAGCTSLTTINTGNVVNFGDYAFTSSANLRTVDLSKAVILGFGALAQTGVTNIGSVDNLVSVGQYAFQGAGFTSFYAPKLAAIGGGAFSNCNNLTKFVFSKDLAYIEEMVFITSGRSSLTTFAYNDGTSEKTQGKINDYAFLEGGALYIVLPSGSYQFQAYPNAKTDTKLEVVEGTVRIATYAGNGNTNVTSIVLPDSLVVIGAHAFRGYENLTSVEFKSFNAPTLETIYNANEELAETDPGYELLHKYIDMFGLTLYYTQFIDLVGRNEPIEMILPSNTDIVGYDHIIYEAFFGKVEDAQRTTYVAKNNATKAFEELIAQLPLDCTTVTLAQESLVAETVAAYNALSQDLTTVGYTADEVAAFAKRVADAQKTIRDLKFAEASDEIKAIQASINALSTTFTIGQLETLKNLAAQINALSYQDRQVLDLTNYNALVASYNAYVAGIASEGNTATNVVNNAYLYTAIAALATLALGFVAFGLVRKFN